MHRIIVIATASLWLGGCASYSFDSFKSAPPTATLQLESVPAGAEARTSLGQSCKTPCSVSVTASEGFSVTYTLNKYQPLTIPVQVTRSGGDFLTSALIAVDPNPVVGELQLASPPRKPVRKMVKKRKPAATAAAPAAGSAFPAPADAPPAAAPAR